MKLVKGYMFRTQIGFVKHVAVFEDGTIKQTMNEHPTNGDRFNGHNWKWETISSIPEKCEFIGNYPANM